MCWWHGNHFSSDLRRYRDSQLPMAIKSFRCGFLVKCNRNRVYYSHIHTTICYTGNNRLSCFDKCYW